MNDGIHMHVTARFIGHDGSCGLKHMQSYRIEIIETPKARYRFRLYVNNLGIPYDSMEAIKANWKWHED